MMYLMTCMATFASEYRVLSKNDKSNDMIELKSGLGLTFP